MSLEEKLFAVYLGGKAKGASIELHDVVFIVGTSIEDTFPRLREKWLGYPDMLPHIDSYIELKHADGYEIKLVRSEKEKTSKNTLYFVNFGAYTENLFGEVHQSAFFVGEGKAAATKKAREGLCVGMIEPHLDDHLEVEGEMEFDKFEVDDVLEVDNVDGYYIDLIPSDVKERSQAHPGYRKIRVQGTAAK